jgi:integrase
MFKIAKWLGKDFDKATKEDIEKLVWTIQSNEKFKDWTKHLYKVSVKKFYKWLNGGEEYPREVKWIKCNFRNSNRILPEELLTHDEVKKMIETAEHPRDKAFIAVLYEGGFRIGEIASLRMKDIVTDEYGAQVIVDGKTGMRRVRLISSAPYLLAWLNMHPLKNSPEGTVWISIGTIHHGKEMAYQSIVSMLKNTALRAGIKKKVNPQNWRRTRATHLAPHLKEMLLDQHFGWVLGSDMPRTYIHLSGREIDDSLLELNGMKKKEEVNQEVLKPKVCEICKYINEATSSFCSKCARPLDLKIMLQLEEKRAKDETLIVKLFETPGMLEHFISNADERNIKQLMETHPNLTARITSMAVRNLRR